MAEPQAILDDLAARAERIETPCGDGTMVWHAWGNGEPLVLAHGAQGSWQHWVRNVDTLRMTRRVIAADLPGHGDSASPQTLDHAGISKALADGLAIIVGEGRAVDLCGFSFGGVCFADLAAYHPQMARRLILVGCGGLGTPHGQFHLQRVSGLRSQEREAVLKSNLLGLMLHHPDSADALAIHMLLPNAKRSIGHWPTCWRCPRPHPRGAPQRQRLPTVTRRAADTPARPHHRGGIRPRSPA